MESQLYLMQNMYTVCHNLNKSLLNIFWVILFFLKKSWQTHLKAVEECYFNQSNCEGRWESLGDLFLGSCAYIAETISHTVTINTAVIEHAFLGAFSPSSCWVSTGSKWQGPRNSYITVTSGNSILFPQEAMRLSRITSARRSCGTDPCSHLVEKCFGEYRCTHTTRNTHEDVTVNATGCRSKWRRPSPVGQCLFRHVALCVFPPWQIHSHSGIRWLLVGLNSTIGHILDTTVSAL